VKAVDARTFTKKQEKLNQTLSACKKSDDSCLLGKEMSADGGIHATEDHNNVTTVSRNAK
jgi:hypothetical protein